MRTLFSECLAALRSLASARWTALAAIVTLAIGTGANVAVLAVAYAALWRPIPVTDPDRLVTISTGRVEEAEINGTVRAQELERWRDGLRTLLGLAGWTSSDFTIRGLNVPEVRRVAIVTDNFFEVMAPSASMGRLFAASTADGLAVASPSLSASLATPLGATLVLGQSALQVVGVLPPEFPVPDGADLWVPVSSVEGVRFGSTSDFRSYRMVGRLAPGVTLAQAQDDADRVNREIEQERGREGELKVVVSPITELLSGEVRPVLRAFVVAAALLLLVACANVATLMVNRALGRRREYAVRLAIGARPAQLLRSALIESLLLALAGAALGAACAVWGIRTLSAFVEDALPRSALVDLGWPALGVAAGSGVVATLVAGGAPALAAVRADFAAVFRTTTATGTPGARRVRSALVVAQLVITAVLLVGAGLFGRTVSQLAATDLGIDSEHSLAMRLRLTDSAGFDAGAEGSRVDDLVSRVRGLPGVEAAGVGSNLPPSVAQVAFSVRVVVNDVVETKTFDFGSASPGYFEAIGARLVRGRWFEARDLDGPAVAVLSESAARHLSSVGDLLDRPLPFSVPTPGGERVTPTVIGIIEDVRHRGLETPPNGGIYVPWSLMPTGVTYLAVKSSRPAAALAPELVRLVRDVSPAWPVPEVRSIEEGVQEALANRELRLVLVGGFGTLAAGLAITGLVGALSRSVHERRREIAIRAALGASPAAASGRILFDGVRLSLLGVGVGLGLAAALGRSIATLVYGVSPFDGATFVTVGAGLLALTALAAWLPARRAARVNPVELLRSEG